MTWFICIWLIIFTDQSKDYLMLATYYLTIFTIIKIMKGYRNILWQTSVCFQGSVWLWFQIYRHYAVVMKIPRSCLSVLKNWCILLGKYNQIGHTDKGRLMLQLSFIVLQKCFSWNIFTVNFLNIQTPKTFVAITLKFELCCSVIE